MHITLPHLHNNNLYWLIRNSSTDDTRIGQLTSSEKYFMKNTKMSKRIQQVVYYIELNNIPNLIQTLHFMCISVKYTNAI